LLAALVASAFPVGSCSFSRAFPGVVLNKSFWEFLDEDGAAAGKLEITGEGFLSYIDVKSFKNRAQDPGRVIEQMSKGAYLVIGAWFLPRPATE
jgi:hypothetical protein